MRRDWNRRARENARHYVVTGQHEWTDEEFFRSGQITMEEEILNDLPNVCQGRDPKHMKVLEIGCGAGRVTRAFAGYFGEVYAVDINPEAIRHIADRAQQEHLRNVKTVLSKPDDPELPANSIDAVLLLKTYHEVASPIVLLRNLRTSLRPNARVGVIDRNGTGEDHGVQKEVVLREAEQAGYRLLEEHDDLVRADKMDYFLVFAAK